MALEAVLRARALLENVTPLRTDCGAVCGGVCCRPLPGEETGMLLFPGEEALYADWKDGRVVQTERGALLVCFGRCQRAQRPLACRLFPLLPLVRPEGVKVATDLRARAVCPLARQGKEALSADFVRAVRQAGALLNEDETQRAFLLRLTMEQDELRALRRRFRRDEHV